MKLAIIIILSLSLQSCMTGLYKNKKALKNPQLAAETIQFNQVDLNKDGTISKDEVLSYNDTKKTKNTPLNLTGPLAIMAGICALIFAICSAGKIKVLIFRLFKKK
tara:strand:+ start:443 stop:760 length:318 start_codon:yes stop_codon:yes gene_type:complete